MSESDLFAQARALPVDDRAAFLDTVCGADEPLRTRLETLLKIDSENTAVFDRNPVSVLQQLESQDDSVASDHAHILEQVLALLDAPDSEGSLGRLEHYNVQSVIGHGGFGIVLKALDEKLNRLVAIKMLSPILAATSPPRKRFLREAKSAAAVQHENVVQIYAVQERPVPYIAMEYIAGQTLQQRFDEQGPLTAQEVVDLGSQVAAGLAVAHAAGIVHRDIKPANILLEEGPVTRVKLSDFGLARAADDATMTQSGFVLGTPMYMAPEQANGQIVDHRSDLFSLGSVLYTVCAGRMPFRAASTIAVLKRVIDDQPRPIRELIPETPPGLPAVIERLHEKHPANRYQSAEEVVADLETCLTKIPYSPQRQRRRLMLAGATVALVAVGWLGIAVVPGMLKSAAPQQTENGLPAKKTSAATPPAETEVTAEPVAANNDDESSVAETPVAEPESPEEILQRQIEKVKLALAADNEHFDPDQTTWETWQNKVGAIKTQSQLQDISALSMLPELEHVEFMVHPSGPVDLGPLAGMKRLRVLLVHGQSKNLKALTNCPLVTLHVHDLADQSLAPLKGCRLRYLACGESSISDLTPLKGMPLRGHLGLSLTAVRDLSPLRGMAIQDLQIGSTRVSDLSPLEGMPLKRLNITNSPIEDTSVLASLPIEDLELDYNPDRDRQMLTLMPRLRSVNGMDINAFKIAHGIPPNIILEDNDPRNSIAEQQALEAIQDIAAITDGFDPLRCICRIKEGRVRDVECHSPIINVAPFARLTQLENLLVVSKGGVVDLGPLSAIRTLTSLHVYGVSRNLPALKGLALRRLHVFGLHDSDLSPLAGMPLQLLNCGNSPVSDLSPLKDCPLTELLCVNMTEVKDLSPLRGKQIKQLMIANSLVTDVSPLEGMPVENLEAAGLALEDTSVFAGMPLRNLGLDFQPTRDAHLLSALDELSFWNRKPFAEFRHAAETKLTTPTRVAVGEEETSRE